MAVDPDWLPEAVADLGSHESYTLPGGRHVSYARFGDEDGRPVLVCHGTPGSRWFGAVFHDVALEMGIQVVAIERPGIGRSSPDAQRAIGNWSEDVVAVAEHNGWDRLPVVGFSGGAPYALDCAGGSGSFAPAVALVAPLGPPAGPGGTVLERLMGRMAVHTPGLLERLFSVFARSARDDPPRDVAESLTSEPILDDPLAGTGTVAEVLAADVLGAFERTTEGVVREFALASRPWSFDLESIEVPVYCWHGVDDENVPVAASRYLCERLPDCTCRQLDGEDHASTLVRNRRHVLEAVT